MNKPRFNSKMLYIMIGAIVLLLVAILLIKAERTLSKQSSSAHLYSIEYSAGTYTYSSFADSIFSQNERCVEFRNLLGQKQKVCANTLIVTQIK